MIFLFKKSYQKMLFNNLVIFIYYTFHFIHSYIMFKFFVSKFWFFVSFNIDSKELFDFMIKWDWPTFNKKFQFLEIFPIEKYYKSEQQNKVLTHLLYSVKQFKSQVAIFKENKQKKNNSKHLQGEGIKKFTSSLRISTGLKEKASLSKEKKQEQGVKVIVHYVR